MGMTFSGRLGIQQRVLTTYRAAFFDALAQACDGGLSIFAGLPRPEESIAVTGQLQVAHFVSARNIHFLRGPFYFCYQRGLQAWLNGWQPQVLIMEANPRYLSTRVGLNWARRRDVPVVGWGLGVPGLSGHLAGLQKAARLDFLRSFEALITYSRRGADEYAALGFPADKIFVAPNAAASPPVSPLPLRPSGYTEKPSVLFVGRLQPRKRLDLLLRACAALPENLKPRLVIVGEGPERQNLETLADKIFPLAEFVGPKFQVELAPYFARADLFVLPGTGGLAVQEAMSHGLPVIMGQGDGTNADLVRPGNGWQIPADDLDALGETLRTALSDISRLRVMGAESYRIVREEINLEKMVGVFVEVLNKIKK